MSIKVMKVISLKTHRVKWSMDQSKQKFSALEYNKFRNHEGFEIDADVCQLH